MTTLNDVLDLASRQPISVEMLQETFGVDEDKACRIIKACWDRGLLVPTPKSWFGLPQEDGLLPYRTPESRKRAYGQAWPVERKLKYYGDELEAIRELYEELGMGITVRDVRERLKLSAPDRARMLLRLLVEVGELNESSASAGGAYGKKPQIYYREAEDYVMRNEIFVAEAPAKNAQRKAKIKATKQMNKEIAQTTPSFSPSPVSRIPYHTKEDEWDSPFDA